MFCRCFLVSFCWDLVHCGWVLGFFWLLFVFGGVFVGVVLMFRFVFSFFAVFVFETWCTLVGFLVSFGCCLFLVVNLLMFWFGLPFFEVFVFETWCTLVGFLVSFGCCFFWWCFCWCFAYVLVWFFSFGSFCFWDLVHCGWVLVFLVLLFVFGGVFVGVLLMFWFGFPFLRFLFLRPGALWLGSWFLLVVVCFWWCFWWCFAYVLVRSFSFWNLFFVTWCTLVGFLVSFGCWLILVGVQTKIYKKEKTNQDISLTPTKTTQNNQQPKKTRTQTKCTKSQKQKLRKEKDQTKT